MNGIDFLIALLVSLVYILTHVCGFNTIFLIAIVSHLSSRPQRRCQLKRQRNVHYSQSEDDSDADFNLRTKRPRHLRAVAIKEETTDASSDEEELKFDPNQPSTSFAHSEFYFIINSELFFF